MPGTLSYVGDSPADTLFDAPYLVRLWVADQLALPSARLSIAEIEEVRIGRAETMSATRSHDGSAVLTIAVPDGWMSSRHAELRREPGGWTLRDLGSKNGCFINGKPATEQALVDGDVFTTGNTMFLFRSRVQRSHAEPPDQDASALKRLPAVQQTLSLALARSLADLAKVASSSIPLLINGETGTGKELSARFVHQQSDRKGSFVAVNCGAIPANLVESELFGHRKGAFSGAASDRVGLVQASDGGTLFLDEVAELSTETQVKLLRVLQEREVVPVGATRPIPVDLRVVCATHEDLESLVEAGRFRADLLARIKGVQVKLPPLRERREDLGILVGGILRQTTVQGLERDAATAIALYSWPANIRELEQSLLAAAAWGHSPIAPAQLPDAVLASLQQGAAGGDDQLRADLTRALQKHQGNVSAVARELGKARVQIRRWCKRFALDPADFRS
jgi:transcriptional regulator with PAS, ATPase and Fis domain